MHNDDLSSCGVGVCLVSGTRSSSATGMVFTRGLVYGCSIVGRSTVCRLRWDKEMKTAGKIGALVFEYLAWCFYMGLLQMVAVSLWGPGQPSSIWLLGGLALLCRWMIEVNRSERGNRTPRG